MGYASQIALQLKQLYFGPSLVGSSLQDGLEGVDWKQATRKFNDLNSIAMLVFHINYYISALLKVLKGGPLDAHDKYSYDIGPIESEEDWQALLLKCRKDAEEYIALVEKMTDEDLQKPMDTGKYGNWFKNLLIIQEHSNYHLGQILLIKKLVQKTDEE